MNRLKNKFLSVLLSATMVAGMLSPMGAQAATITSGDEYITMTNGIEAKLTVQMNGADGEAVLAEGPLTQ